MGTRAEDEHLHGRVSRVGGTLEVCGARVHQRRPWHHLAVHSGVFGGGGIRIYVHIHMHTLGVTFSIYNYLSFFVFFLLIYGARACQWRLPHHRAVYSGGFGTEIRLRVHAHVWDCMNL